MNLGARIKAARLHIGWEQSDLCRASKVAQATLSALETRDSNRSNYADQLISAFPADKINHAWLRTGRGSMEPSSPPTFDVNAFKVEAGKRAYPVISHIQAGVLKEISDPYAKGDGFDVEYGDDEWSKWSFFLEIGGESMLPDFKPGDRVLIDPEIAPRPGDFVAAKNDGEGATFKKYRARGIDSRGNAVFELVPLNPDYETLRSDELPLVVIGVMVEHRRKYRRN